MIYILLIIFQLKHFIADYLLQTPYMLGKFKSEGWVKPLAAHCRVHFLFTGLIAVSFGVSFPVALALAALDFSIHFIMDRIKASPQLLGKFQAITKSDFEKHTNDIKNLTREMNSLTSNQETLHIAAEVNAEINEKQTEWHFKMKSNTYFWYSLGLDQMVHHLTDILIIYLIMQTVGG